MVLSLLLRRYYIEQVFPFKQLCAQRGSLCLLVTTRLRELASRAGDVHPLEPLPEALGLQLLLQYMQSSERKIKAAGHFESASLLVKKCNGLPVMIRSLATMCRSQSINYVLAYLEKHKLEHAVPMVDGAEDYDYTNLFIAIEGSLSLLGKNDSTTVRCLEMLAIFPEDKTIPLNVVSCLWDASAAETEQYLRTLSDWHLLERKDGEVSGVYLLDLHRDYLRCRAKHSLASWHGRFLSTCAQGEIGPNAEDSYWQSEDDFFYHVQGALSDQTHASDSLRLHKVATLNLGGTELSEQHARLLANLLGRGCLPGVEVIDLEGCFPEVIDSEEGCFPEIASALHLGGAPSSLRELNLASNNLVDASMIALGGTLVAGKDVLNSLQKLDLSENHVSDAGLAALVLPCMGGRAMRSLASLLLGKNLIGPTGFASLVEALAEGAFRVLKECFLSDNQLKTLDPLLAAASGSSTVLQDCQTIDLSNTGLSDDTAGEPLARMLDTGALKSLRVLRLGFNEMTERGKTTVQAACDRRQVRVEGLRPLPHDRDTALSSASGAPTK